MRKYNAATYHLQNIIYITHPHKTLLGPNLAQRKEVNFVTR